MIRRLEKYLPLTLLTYIPLWHVTKVGKSPLLIYDLIRFDGFVPFIKSQLHISVETMALSLLFFLFVKHIAPKISLFVSSSVIALLYYLCQRPTLVFDALPLLLIASSLNLNLHQQKKHLFFSLYFFTVLFSVSSLSICITYYGYNIPLFLMMITPAAALYLLAISDIYPKSSISIPLFATATFPLAFLTHNPALLSASYSLIAIVFLFVIIALLHKTNKATLAIATASTLTLFFFADKALSTPLLVMLLSQALASMQLFYASRPHLSSHTPVLPHPMQPFSPSFRFYNEYMHY